MTDTVKKWEFVPEDTIFHTGLKLTRIRALVDYPNGHAKAGELGGYIEKSENLLDWGWVGDNAKVFDNAQVYGNAKVYGNGQVYGNAGVLGFGQVYGDGQVYDNGRVTDNGQVYEDGKVHGDGRVCHHGKIYGNGQIYDNGLVHDFGLVYGNGRVYGDGLVCDYGQVHGNGMVYDNGQVRDYSEVCNEGVVAGQVCVSSNGYVANIEDVILFYNVGTEKDTLTAHRQKDGSVNLVRGCLSGSIEEFLAASAVTHRNLPDIKREYELIIEVIKHRFKIS